MVKSKNIFFINIIPKIVVVNLPGLGVFTVSVLLDKKKVRLKFQKKSKKKTVIINPCCWVGNMFINYNKSIQQNTGIFNFTLKKILFLLKYKVK